MKKTILIISAISSSMLVNAQKAEVVSAFNYNKAYERSLKCSELQNGLTSINKATEDATTKEYWVPLSIFVGTGIGFVVANLFSDKMKKNNN